MPHTKTIIFVALFCLIFTGLTNHEAKSDTAVLRNYHIGDRLPGFKLPQLQGGRPLTIIPGQGKPTLMMFFSIHPNFRKKRSLALLSVLSHLSQKYGKKVQIVAIYSDNKDQNQVINFMRSAAPHIRVVADSTKALLEHYGVFMMPIVVLTNEKGELNEVIPYTYNIQKVIGGNIKFLLGKWTKKQLLKALAPKANIKLSKNEKEYIRRVNYGRIMTSKKMYKQAVREFNTAIKIMPKQINAYLELGFTLLAEKQWDKAEAAFKKAQLINKDSDDAMAGLGLSYYGRGKTEQAKNILESAFIAPHPRLEVIISLADIYESEGNNRKANRFNKLAVSRLMTMYEQRWQ